LVPWGVDDYSSGTAQAVMDFAPNARQVYACGSHVSKDNKDKYSKLFTWTLSAATVVARLFRFVDIDDQLRATSNVFASQGRWTVVRGPSLEEGASEGLPLWAVIRFCLCLYFCCGRQFFH
jgi:hypothetical protein